MMSSFSTQDTGKTPVEDVKELQKDGVKGTYRVDVDIPADEWINITKFYDVLIFNTGHC
jgi:hypothetical protein